MKKIISTILITLICLACFSTISSYAATLDKVTLDVDKQIVRPSEEVKVTLNFGKSLSEYTFNIAFDNKLFDYEKVEEGAKATVDADSKKVVLTQDADSEAKESVTITFKAKADLLTSNPTEFTVVGTNLKGETEEYDDITTPIVKNVTVEPEYKDYTITFEPIEGFKKGEEKEMTLKFASSMGRFYEHARLIAVATTPEGATVKINAINEEEKVEQDLIKSGWGDPQGYKIGGKDFSQDLKVKTTFDKDGEYKITLKLIDRDKSDSVIAEKDFAITVGEKTIDNAQNKPNIDAAGKVETNKTEMPKKLPKTGYNIYVPMAVLIAIVVSFSIYYNFKKQK